jgi:hypothetical protein
MERITRFLAPALRGTCQMLGGGKLTFFPSSHTRGGPPHTSPSAIHSRPLPVCPASVSPPTPPPRGMNTLRPLIEDISSLAPLAVTPRYTLPQRPLHLVELSGGIATGLEAVLKARNAVASYIWADIDPDAHIAIAHRLTRLRHRHPNLLPGRQSMVGTSDYPGTHEPSPLLYSRRPSQQGWTSS